MKIIKIHEYNKIYGSLNKIVVKLQIYTFITHYYTYAY